jgi:hypothetical protein
VEFAGELGAQVEELGRELPRLDERPVDTVLEAARDQVESFVDSRDRLHTLDEASAASFDPQEPHVVRLLWVMMTAIRPLVAR